MPFKMEPLKPTLPSRSVTPPDISSKLLCLEISLHISVKENRGEVSKTFPTILDFSLCNCWVYLSQWAASEPLHTPQLTSWRCPTHQHVLLQREPGVLGENAVATTDLGLCVRLSRLRLQPAKGASGRQMVHGPGLNMHQLAERTAHNASAEIQQSVMKGTASLPPPSSY